MFELAELLAGCDVPDRRVGLTGEIPEGESSVPSGEIVAALNVVGSMARMSFLVATSQIPTRLSPAEATMTRPSREKSAASGPPEPSSAAVSAPVDTSHSSAGCPSAAVST